MTKINILVFLRIKKIMLSIKTNNIPKQSNIYVYKLLYLWSSLSATNINFIICFFFINIKPKLLKFTIVIIYNIYFNILFS